jgi:protein phosphatase
MGGHAGGQVASELAVTTIINHVQTATIARSPSASQLDFATAILTEAVTAAKLAIEDRIAREPELHNMGTTMVSAWLLPHPTPSLAIAHVGDSRAYLIRDARLVALTTDHSLVQQLVAEGHITPEESLDHPKRNVIIRALGLSFPSTPEIAIHPLFPEDIILLCTDGLTKTLSEEEILAIILASRRDPAQGCMNLIARTNAAGAQDNTTVLLIIPHVA